MKKLLLPLSIFCSLSVINSVSLACVGFTGTWTCHDLDGSKIYSNIRGYPTTAVVEQKKEEFVMGTFVIDGGSYILADRSTVKSSYSGQCLSEAQMNLNITQEFINFGRSNFAYTKSTYDLISEQQMNLTIEQTNTMSPQVKKRTINCTK